MKPHINFVFPQMKEWTKLFISSFTYKLIIYLFMKAFFKYVSYLIVKRFRENLNRAH